MNDLVIQGNNPMENIRQSTDVAGACKEIVSRTSIKIQNRKYVPVEGWMAIATAHGCNLSATDVKQTDGGISARGIVRRIADGLIIGEAEGFVGDDEKTWANRPLFARRAMAQTRAMSRAARSVFAHVVVLMDAGLETTPAEEMDHMPVEREINPAPKPVAQAQAKPAPQPPQAKPEPQKSNLEITFGKFKSALAESLLQLDVNRLIKALQTFDKYVAKLDQTTFEDYEYTVNQTYSRLLDLAESNGVTLTKDQCEQLTLINKHWAPQLAGAYKSEEQIEKEEIIF